MATEEELERGIRAAHAAGNVEHAKKFADEIRRMRGETKMPTPMEAAGTAALGGLREAGQGLSFGTSDEIEAGARSLFSDDSYSDIQKGIADERSAYSERHPIASTVANVSGGILSPVNKLKMLNWSPKTGMDRIKKVGQGIAEGGAVGFASGDGDVADRLRSGAGGAAFGGALSGTANTIGQVGSTATALRVKEALEDAAGNFKPLNLADDGLLGKFYRTAVGRATGSGDLEKQSSDFIANAKNTKEGLVKSRNQFISGEKASINQQKDVATDAITAQKRAARDAAQAEIDAINLQRVQREATDVNSTEAAQAAAGKVFRDDIVEAGIPDHTPPELRHKFMVTAQSDPQKAAGELHNYWTNNGFKEVKGMEFDVDPGQVVRQIQKDMPSHMDDAMPTIQKIMKSKLDPNVKMAGPTPTSWEGGAPVYGKGAYPTEGKISGADLMEARNEFRFLVNSLGDEGDTALEKAAYAQAADKLDDVIKNQLPEGLQASYKKELGQWGEFLTMRESAGKAGVNKQGFFDESDVLSAERSAQKSKFSEGNTPSRSQAQQSQVAAKEGESLLKKKMAQINEQAGRQKAEVKRNLTQTGDALSNQKSQQNRVFKKALANVDERVPAEMNQGIDEATAIYDTAYKRKIAESKGTVETLSATALLGSLPAGALAPITGFLGVGPTALASGAAIAKGLSKPGVQKALAGQLDMQKNLRDVLETLSKHEVDKFLSNSSKAVRNWYLTEEDL